VRNHRKFERLQDFSLENALLEVEKVQPLKESTSDGTTESVEGKKELWFQRPGSDQSTRRNSSQSSIHSITNPLPGSKNGFIPTEEWVKYI
jgi:hypothetical protein